jgi:Type I phosphodiesterase / nucleotide pyrophosphatase
MSDVTADILPRLKSHRLAGLDLDKDFVYPDYQNGSILNLPSSICHWLGAPPFGTGPLREEFSCYEGGDIRRVILILVDALSLHRLQRWMADGTCPVWARLAEQGKLTALTSITPSTTSAALTTLWTGRSPTEHGIVGYELWLKEYGVVANMILHTPTTFENDAGSLARAGFNPAQFLNLTTLGEHLAANGVKSYALQHRSIVRSGLSQMFLKEVQTHGYLTSAELWVNLRHLVESNPGMRQYIWIYTGQIDHFSHYYHPDDERVAAEFAEFSRSFEQHFIRKLHPTRSKNTLLLLVADHGMRATKQTAYYDLCNHPELVHNLHIMPTGESRTAYLFIKPGRENFVRPYIEQAWPGQFTFINPSEAISTGLFGPGTPHPMLTDRLGDLIVIAKKDAYLWWAIKENFLIGRHGGLSAEEMIVPFLSVLL